MKTIKEKFVTPDNEYTPFPFWFWNDNLSKKEIETQIEDFYEKGINGFVLHPRIGLPKQITYLGETFFYYVKFAIRLAEKKGMKVILYDEGMYPSGSANGQVVRDHPEYASKGIYVIKAEDFAEREDRFQKVLLCFQWDEKSEKVLTDRENSNPKYYLIHEDSMGTIRGIHFGEDDGEKNAPRSTDLLNSQACEYFISLTHEKYFQHLDQYFGNTIIGFFTDEPDILGRNSLNRMLPYNEELDQVLHAAGIELYHLPKLFLKNKQKNHLERMYQECVTIQLQKSYYKPISQWCQDHHIFLTGHPHDCQDIGLLNYFQLPGQDVVWRWVAPENDLAISGYESVTAKCSADAARHAGNERNANECFGCCGHNGKQWSFSADEMKWYLDWLFIRGVNFIIPHAFFYSLKGKRKEDRPPDIGRNNLWWPYYHYFSKYIKRMSYMMSNQTNQTNIAILAEKKRLPYEGIDSFIQNQIEFNYLEDTYLLEGNFFVENGKVHVAKQSYDCLIIDSNYPRKKQIRDILSEFSVQDGQLLILGESENFKAILPFIKNRYNRNLHFYGKNLENLRYTEFIKDDTLFFGLSNEGERTQKISIILPSVSYGIEVWNPWNGEIQKYKTENEGNKLDIVLQRRTLLFFTLSDEIDVCFPIMEEKNRKWEIPFRISTNHSLIKDIGSWTNHKELVYFSGTVKYMIELIKETLDNLDLPETIIFDLGEVKNIATLFIDGKERKTVFWAPYTFSLTKEELLQSEIKIAVSNTLSNQFDKEKLISGLIGPIRFMSSE